LQIKLKKKKKLFENYRKDLAKNISIHACYNTLMHDLRKSSLVKIHNTPRSKLRTSLFPVSLLYQPKTLPIVFLFLFGISKKPFVTIFYSFTKKRKLTTMIYKYT
jgi:hypothetical protein